MAFGQLMISRAEKKPAELPDAESVCVHLQKAIDS